MSILTSRSQPKINRFNDHKTHKLHLHRYQQVFKGIHMYSQVFSHICSQRLMNGQSLALDRYRPADCQHLNVLPALTTAQSSLIGRHIFCRSPIGQPRQKLLRLPPIVERFKTALAHTSMCGIMTQRTV